MAKKGKKKKNKEINVDVTSILLIVIGIILSVFVYGSDTGFMGGMIKDVLLGLFGNIMYAMPIILMILGIYVIFRDFSRLKLKSFLVILMVFISSAIISTMPAGFTEAIQIKFNAPFDYIAKWYELGISGVGGGVIGSAIAYFCNFCIGILATRILLWSIAIIIFSITTGITFSAIVIAIKDVLSQLIEAVKKEYIMKKKYKNNSDKFKKIVSQAEIIEAAEQLNFELEDDEEEKEEAEEEKEKKLEEKEQAKQNIKEIFSKKKEEEKKENEAEVLNIEHNVVEEYENYEYPSIDLLKFAKHTGKDYSSKELKEIAIKLQKTLASFGVDAKVTNVTKGPTVTRYELQPNVGVKVSKILNLSDDIALNLAAKSIRIEAPIPGKSAVGIEVPNKVTEMVSLREVVESEEFKNATSKVSFSLGKSIDGIPFIADISKMPHLLISGSTGSRKKCMHKLNYNEYTFQSKTE